MPSYRPTYNPRSKKYIYSTQGWKLQDAEHLTLFLYLNVSERNCPLMLQELNISNIRLDTTFYAQLFSVLWKPSAVPFYVKHSLSLNSKSQQEAAYTIHCWFIFLSGWPTNHYSQIFIHLFLLFFFPFSSFLHFSIFS